MIKPIGNSESISSNFDNLLSNLSSNNLAKEIGGLTEKVEKQSNDEFQKSFDPKKLEQKISKLLEDDSLIAKFSTDKETEKLILKIINEETEEVVRQYPPEVSLKIARIVNKIIENNNIADVRI